MNDIEFDALTPFERDELRRDAAALCSDPSIGSLFTYRQRGTPTRSLTTGVVTESFTTYSVYMVKAPTENDEGTGAQLGAVVFLASASLIESHGFTPGVSDEIVEGSTVHQVLKAERDPVGVLWQFTCRREGAI